MGMLYVIYGYGYVVYDKKFQDKKQKMKMVNDSLWKAQMVQTQIQHHLRKKKTTKPKPEFLFKYQPLMQKPKGNYQCS